MMEGGFQIERYTEGPDSVSFIEYLSGWGGIFAVANHVKMQRYPVPSQTDGSNCDGSPKIEYLVP